jgi:hypothetical protein
MTIRPTGTVPVFASHGPAICAPLRYSDHAPDVPTVPQSSTVLHEPTGSTPEDDTCTPEKSARIHKDRFDIKDTRMIGPSTDVRSRNRLEPDVPTDVKNTCSDAQMELDVFANDFDAYPLRLTSCANADGAAGDPFAESTLSPNMDVQFPNPASNPSAKISGLASWTMMGSDASLSGLVFGPSLAVTAYV